VILERRYLVGRYCPGLTGLQLKGSLYEVLTQHYRLRIAGAEQMIRAVSLSAKDARMLQLPSGSAALLVHAVGQTEEPLWVEDTLYRGDRYEFHNALGRSKRPQPANLAVFGSTSAAPGS
jgi:GntR family transcriptional regulator